MIDRTIRELNHFIRNEEEMIETLNYMVNEVEDPELKEILKGIQEDHFRQMMSMADRVYELGGLPKIETGVLSREEVKSIRDKKDVTDLENAKIALENEKNNTDRLSAYADHTMDKTSLELIEKATHAGQKNIEALMEYIDRNQIQ
ncbi:MAG: ferritin-like domain-containing protein [Clostridiaceae bacterium]|nr:ferritin-like domain-containing protein [Clostridiaceae bacterium]